MGFEGAADSAHDYDTVSGEFQGGAAGTGMPMGLSVTASGTPLVQLALAFFASTFTFTCLYCAHMQLLRFLWPQLFDLDLRLRMANAERCNGLWHSSATVLLSGYGLWASYSQHGWFQYDAPNSSVRMQTVLPSRSSYAVQSFGAYP